jgi:hypothetical protein
MPRFDEAGLKGDIDFDALFAQDLPPRHDGEFVAAVAHRVSRRRLAFELAWGALVAAVSALVLWAVGPVFAPVLKPVGQTLMMFAPLAAIAATAAFLIHPRTALI